MNRLSTTLHALKDRLEAFAATPYALSVLFLVAFIEASIFPIPPDILFLALAVAKPRSSFLFATVCVAASVAGAMLGYVIGSFLFEVIGDRVVSALGMSERFSAVLGMYHANAWLTLLAAGFTNIPFSVFTLAAGFRHTLDPWTLFFGALAGRAVRFYLLGLLLFLYGPAIKDFIDRYVTAISFATVILMVLTFVLLRA